MTGRDEPVAQLLREFAVVHRPSGDAELEAVHLGLLLEDVLDVVLPDSGMSALGSVGEAP